MIELILASQNKHKRDEITAILEGQVKITTLDELHYFHELDESYNTIEENALEKCRFVHDMFSKDCFSEDTGLEVVQLFGEPGVKSARYAGENKDAGKNIALLLSKMENIQIRAAQFRTVISLIYKNKEYSFEGICRGQVATKVSGGAGFGYDPVFIPDGYSKTFAEMDISLKNQISHRSEAMNKLKNFLNQLANHQS